MRFYFPGIFLWLSVVILNFFDSLRSFTDAHELFLGKKTFDGFHIACYEESTQLAHHAVGL